MKPPLIDVVVPRKFTPRQEHHSPRRLSHSLGARTMTDPASCAVQASRSLLQGTLLGGAHMGNLLSAPLCGSLSQCYRPTHPLSDLACLQRRGVGTLASRGRQGCGVAPAAPRRSGRDLGCLRRIQALGCLCSNVSTAVGSCLGHQRPVQV